MAFAQSLTLDELKTYADVQGRGLKDWTPALKASRVKVISDTIRNFNSEKSPTGRAWKPLRPISTRSRRQRSSKPLQNFGFLKQSIIGGQGNVNELTKDSLEYGTKIEYAATHQPPGDRSETTIKGRPLLAIPMTVNAAKYNPRKSPSYPGNLNFVKSRKGNLFLIDNSIAGSLFRKIQYILKASVTIPARPFIGFSARLQEDVQKIFTRFVEKQTRKTTNTFKVKTIENHFDNAGVFVDEGSVFENGTIASSVSKGFFRGKIFSDDGFDTVETAEQFFAVTDTREIEGDAYMTRVIKAAKAHLFNIGSFPGSLTSDRVYDFALQNPAIGQHVTFPCILFSYGTSVEIGGTNLRDDGEYPILVTVLNRKAPTARPEDVDTEMKWFDLIQTFFRSTHTLREGHTH